MPLAFEDFTRLREELVHHWGSIPDPEDTGVAIDEWAGRNGMTSVLMMDLAHEMVALVASPPFTMLTLEDMTALVLMAFVTGWEGHKQYGGVL